MAFLQFRDLLKQSLIQISNDIIRKDLVELIPEYGHTTKKIQKQKANSLPLKYTASKKQHFLKIKKLQN